MRMKIRQVAFTAPRAALNRVSVIILFTEPTLPSFSALKSILMVSKICLRLLGLCKCVKYKWPILYNLLVQGLTGNKD